MGTEDSTSLGRTVISGTRRGQATALVRSRHRAEAHGSLVEAETQRKLPLQEPWPGFLPGPGVAPLVVAGVSDVELDGHHSSARRVEVKGLHVALRLRDPPLVVVLGDEALGCLNPSVIGPLLRRPGAKSFGIARTTPAHVVAAWARSCPIEFVPEGRLPPRLALACRLDIAILGDTITPLRDRRSERMRLALVALRGTEDCRVKSWAQTLGTSRHALRRLCNAALGVPPEEIAWTFFDARVRREVLHGRSDEEIAAVLGITGAFELRRAYARRGLSYPRT